MLVETVAIGATAGVQKGRGGLTWGPNLALLEKHNGSFRTWPSVVRFNVILAFVHRLPHPWLCGNVDPTRQGSRRLFSEENMHLFFGVVEASICIETSDGKSSTIMVGWSRDVLPQIHRKHYHKLIKHGGQMLEAMCQVGPSFFFGKCVYTKMHTSYMIDRRAELHCLKPQVSCRHIHSASASSPS